MDVIRSFRHKGLQELYKEGSSREQDNNKVTKMPQEFLARGKPRRPPIHPGEILREDVLPALNLSVSEAARQLRVTRQTLHRILSGTSGISPEMAVRLGKFCGNGPGLWLRMQQNHDLWYAEKRLHNELEKIPVRGGNFRP